MEGTLREDRYTFMTIPRSFLITMRNVSDKSCTENQNTHFVFSNFPPENRAVYEIMWKKYCTAGRATDDNMAHAHCVLDTYGYKHTLTICNTYYIYTAVMVTRT